MKNVLVFLLAVFFLIFAGCVTDVPVPSQDTVLTNTQTKPPAPAVTAAPTPEPTPIQTTRAEPVEISIMSVGDIMFHGAQIKAAYDESSKTHDFSYSFSFINDIIKRADLAIANLECPLAGPDKPYSYPNSKSFSAPDSAAAAIKDAGFDVLSTINNHSNDRGIEGVVRTVDAVRRHDMVALGTRKDADEPLYYILDINDVSVGIAAYSYGTRPGKDSVALNGTKLKGNGKDLINIFTYKTIKDDLIPMGKLVQEMKNAGAEVVVFVIHAGTEGSRKPNKYQEQLARGLCDAGVDIIFGSHPHVLQPIEIITSQNGHRTLVAYSLGNFISNQRTKYNKKWTYNEDAMILNVKIKKYFDGSPIEITAVEYLPTWTMLYTKGSKRYYAVLPLEKALASPDDFDLNTSYNLRKAKQSFEATNELMAKAVEKGYLALMKTD
ncbi:MAG: CapA family protein [Christensenellales bacterium]